MIAETQDDAIEKAQKLLKACRVNTVPTPLPKIAALLGIMVVEVELDDSTSGFLKRRGKNTRPVIAINKNHPVVRQRFTLAHELGHYVLHSLLPLHIDKASVEFRKKSSSIAVDIKEVQANRFAAELLMPQNTLAQYLNGDFPPMDSEEAKKKISDLASTFNVSDQAMSIRIGGLLY